MILLEILLTTSVVILFAEFNDRFTKYIKSKKDKKPKTLEGEFIAGFHD